MKKASIFLIILNMFLLVSKTYAYTDQIEDLLDKYQGRIYPEVKYLEKSDDLKCIKGVTNNTISEIIDRMDFSPECIWKTIRKYNAESKERIPEKVLGFSFGSVIDASIYVGITNGQELVVQKVDNNTLMVGYIKYSGGSLSVSLPGPSLTQSVIFGVCKDNIFGYLGWFKNKGRFAITSHYGIYENIFDTKYTGCKAISSTLGLSSPIGIASATEYKQNGEFMLVTGPRVKKLIQYINWINAKKGYINDKIQKLFTKLRESPKHSLTDYY